LIILPVSLREKSESDWTQPGFKLASMMFSLAIGLGGTGYLMTNGRGRRQLKAHELLATAFSFFSSELVLHSLRNSDSI
jgi:hypothetical protein